MRIFSAGIVIVSMLLLAACDEQTANYQEENDPILITDFSSPPTFTIENGYSRVLEDQKDVGENPHTIHVVYAVPKGNKDQGRDKNYQIQNSVLAANDWFKKISLGKAFDLDFQESGDLDVTYWPMEQTNLEILKRRDGSIDVLRSIDEAIKQTTWFDSNKLYAVYLEGAHLNTCGDASVGYRHVVGIYLFNPISDPRYTCASNPFSNGSSVGYVETVLIHELIHALGVPHVFDSVNDIIYGGNEPKTTPNGLPNVVDFNSDDYYKHGIPNKLDINYSAFLTPQDGSELPPYWR